MPVDLCIPAGLRNSTDLSLCSPIALRRSVLLVRVRVRDAHVRRRQGREIEALRVHVSGHDQTVDAGVHVRKPHVDALHVLSSKASKLSGNRIEKGAHALA